VQNDMHGQGVVMHVRQFFRSLLTATDMILASLR
jgi:hypothetical protein